MPFPPNIDLSSLDGSNGFRIDGEVAGDWSGISVASAGDLNGDGFEDLIVGTPHGGNNSAPGFVGVVFGTSAGFAATFDLTSLDGSNGFQLTEAVDDGIGWSVASAGDVNADGFADLIVGAPGDDPNGPSSGAAYVLFGTAAGFAADLDVSTLDGTNGFQLSGETQSDNAGISVATAGDINGDGFADMFVGTSDKGASYVVFGKATGFPAELQLSSLDGSNGFRLAGQTSGSPVTSAGDVNGDGFDDFIVGSSYVIDPDIGSYGEAAYVVYGKATGFAAALDLSSLDGSNGFQFATAYGGLSIASAGDVNGDGFADLIVGMPYSNANGSFSGAAAVVFGKASGNLGVDGLDGSNGFWLIGEGASYLSGYAVSSAGDVNGDGFDDVLVSAVGGNNQIVESAYVVFGKAAGFAASLDLADLDGVNGFKLTGVGGDSLGRSVSSAGDVNGDGFADLIVGAPNAQFNGFASGSSYVVFGGAFGAIVTTTGTVAVDMLIGGTGDDTLKGGGGGDAFHAGAGNDRIVVGDLGFLLADGGTGFDTFALGGMDLSLDVTNRLLAARVEGIERLDLRNAGSNTLTIDQLAVLDGLGAVSGGNHVLTVRGDAADTVLFVEAGWEKVGSFTNAEGTFFRYVLGNAEVDIKQGVVVPGATITGTSGDDTIDESTTIVRQPLPTNRDGVIQSAGGNDTISALAGNDTLYGGAGNDTLDGGAGNDILNGGEGQDTASYASATAGVKVSLLIAGQQDTLGAGKDTLSFIEKLTGSGFADTLIGDGGGNVLDGGGGDDTLNGGAGNDQLIGGGGTDTATYASAAAGVQASLSIASAQNTLGAGKDTLSGIEKLTGSGFADTLTGDAGVNLLNGGNGADVLVGRAGADSLNGGNGNDTASYAGAAAGVTASLAAPATNTGDAAGDSYVSIESLAGSNYADLLTGNSASNILSGRGGADQLDGGAGNDRLSGGGGLDSLTGGLDDDTFVFDRMLVAGNVSTIVDFSHADDTIALSLAIFTAAGPAGTLAAGAFFVGAAAHDADDRILYDSSNGKLLYDADGNGVGAAKVFAVAGTGLSIAANDFTLQ